MPEPTRPLSAPTQVGDQNTVIEVAIARFRGLSERPLVIGVLGGVASGKSVVTERFRELGAGVLDGDRAGHEVLRQPEVIATLVERWGEAVLTVAGEVDRRAVAARVFGPGPAAAAELEFLERATHPRIGELLVQQIVALAARQVPAVVLDAPVMLKAGWDRLCDKIVFVEAPREVRSTRASGRGWSEADFAAREGAQETLDVKRARADFVIDNAGSLESTLIQVDQIWNSLRAPGPAGQEIPTPPT